jgi:hypothetical protein
VDKPSTISSQKQLVFDVQRTFNETLEGQRIWQHLETVCFEKTTGFSQDPYVHAFNAGVRSVLLHLKTLKSIDPLKAEDRLKEMETQENGQS